jgi:hypothetical protein
VGDILNYLQGLPFADGSFFEKVDLRSYAAMETRTYPLKHTLNRKARGILALACHPVQHDFPSVPGGVPSHIPTEDTDSIAYVCMSAAMANDFLWDLWVY